MTTERLHKKGILLRLGLSVVLASVMTVLFCLVYTAGRDWLLQAIESHSLAFLENFDLLGKVQARDKAMKILSQRLNKMRTRLITAYIATAFGIGGAVASILLQVLK